MCWPAQQVTEEKSLESRCEEPILRQRIKVQSWSEHKIQERGREKQDTKISFKKGKQKKKTNESTINNKTPNHSHLPPKKHK